MKDKHTKTFLIIIFVLVTVFLLNLIDNENLITDLTLNKVGRFSCFAIAALGVDMIWGFAGILSMCQAFFFCLGGYCVGMHMLLKTGKEGVYGTSMPDFMVWNQVKELPVFWKPFHSMTATLGLTVLAPGLFALILGFLVFRSRAKGVYFAIITQALAWAMWLVFNRNETMLGGTNGLTDFKTLFNFELQSASTKKVYIL